MSQRPTSKKRSDPSIGGDAVQYLAERAIELLAKTTPNGAAQPIAKFQDFTNAFLAPDNVVRQDLLTHLMYSGVTAAQIIEDIIPATARYIGELWMQDKLSFAEVSIGSARLQETVRALEQPTDPKVNGPSVSLIVPQQEHHTLGAYVLAEQFRNLGCHTRVIVGTSLPNILTELRRSADDLIGISIGGSRTHSHAREMIGAIRRTIPVALPIAVGGAGVNPSIDILKATDADFVCTNASQAIHFAKLELPPSVARSKKLA